LTYLRPICCLKIMIRLQNHISIHIDGRKRAQLYGRALTNKELMFCEAKT
jgi:hypothetical protein